MAQLKHWLDAQFEERTVEPNSSLGKALHYLLTHWQTLTRFLEVPGAPLENNTAERALKLAIRQRKNSLFYKTDYSAYIASMLTSLIATCLQGRGECTRVPRAVCIPVYGFVPVRLSRSLTVVCGYHTSE